LNTDHATRLWLIVVLQTRLDRPDDGWVKPRKQLLDGVGLPHHLRDVIARLERSGAVLVRRRSGKRALLKLVDSEHNPARAT
jgi:hypothetical protein